MNNTEERVAHARELHRGGCNCCQAVVMAWADKLPIAEEQAKAVASGFGRGLAGTREVCGCVSGMAMVAGLTGHNAELRDMIEQFRSVEGDIVCGRLLAAGKKPCNDMVADATAIIGSVL